MSFKILIIGTENPIDDRLINKLSFPVPFVLARPKLLKRGVKFVRLVFGRDKRFIVPVRSAGMIGMLGDHGRRNFSHINSLILLIPSFKFSIDDAKLKRKYLGVQNASPGTTATNFSLSSLLHQSVAVSPGFKIG